MKLKTPPGPLFSHASGGGRGGGRGGGGERLGLRWVSTDRHLFRYSRNPSVLRQVSKGDQSHFEAAGALFVCEGCEVLPK